MAADQDQQIGRKLRQQFYRRPIRRRVDGYRVDSGRFSLQFRKSLLATRYNRRSGAVFRQI